MAPSGCKLLTARCTVAANGIREAHCALRKRNSALTLVCLANLRYVCPGGDCLTISCGVVSPVYGCGDL